MTFFIDKDNILWMKEKDKTFNVILAKTCAYLTKIVYHIINHMAYYSAII